MERRLGRFKLLWSKFKLKLAELYFHIYLYKCSVLTRCRHLVHPLLSLNLTDHQTHYLGDL